MESNWRNSYLRYKSLFLNVLSVYRKKPQIMLFFEVILTFITITIFSIFALKPTLVTIINLVKEVKAKQEVSAELDKKIADLVKAQDNFTLYSKQIAILNNAIPTTSDIDNFMGQMIGTASTSSVSLGTITIDETTLKGTTKKKAKKDEESLLPEDVDSITFNLTTSGDYSQLFNYLGRLENLRRPIIFNSLAFTQTSRADSAPFLSLTVTGQSPFTNSQP